MWTQASLWRDFGDFVFEVRDPGLQRGQQGLGVGVLAFPLVPSGGRLWSPTDLARVLLFIPSPALS